MGAVYGGVPDLPVHATGLAPAHRQSRFVGLRLFSPYRGPDPRLGYPGVGHLDESARTEYSSITPLD